MNTKFMEYPDAILLQSNLSTLILDVRTNRLWSIGWSHEEHTLKTFEILDSRIIAGCAGKAHKLELDKFLILNPFQEMYEMLLKISLDNLDRSLKVTLLKRPFLGGLDFKINSDVIYYGSCSPFYGYIGPIEDENGTRTIDGTLVDKFPIFGN